MCGCSGVLSCDFSMFGACSRCGVCCWAYPTPMWRDGAISGVLRGMVQRSGRRGFLQPCRFWRCAGSPLSPQRILTICPEFFHYIRGRSFWRFEPSGARKRRKKAAVSCASGIDGLCSVFCGKIPRTFFPSLFAYLRLRRAQSAAKASSESVAVVGSGTIRSLTSAALSALFQSVILPISAFGKLRESLPKIAPN